MRAGGDSDDSTALDGAGLDPVALDPVTFEVLRHRLLAINDEAVFTIMQVSANRIATEANDLNSALMTADGEVVVSGLWVLVHSCSLNTLVQRVVRDFQTNPGIGPGDMFITNDPYVTGRHQLDVVVVAPIFRGERLVAWSGTIVHQNDVGGPVAAGFAPGARNIFEEAIPMAPMRIVEGGTLRQDVEMEYLIRSRTPELNRLDLLAQIAANRVHGQRLHELCDTYGDDTVIEALRRLLSTTETRLRRRLAALPDGRWRHTGYMEHDGVEDRVYRVSCTMTKLGEYLELDFTDSSDQAQGMINAPHGCMRCFSVVALMTMLGYDGIPWVPGAFERVVDFVTREGTVTHARWPAGTSMAGTAAGQEIRTAVQVCMAGLLDASDDEQRMVMAPGMTSAPGTAISGTSPAGPPFSSILVDAQLGGGGARHRADGADTAGLLHSPGATTSNIEENEWSFPLQYLHRRERPDSGGPGATRGGIGSEHALMLRSPSTSLQLVLFGHGIQQPSSAGVRGGEPGRQNAFHLRRRHPGVDELPPPKCITSLEVGDVFTTWCAGGGGIGDPLDRDPDLVGHDADEGLVTEEGARLDYGVVLLPLVGADAERGALDDRGWRVDGSATNALRAEIRRRRLRGATPAASRSEAPTGRRLSATLELVDDRGTPRIACRRCGRRHCEWDHNVKLHLAVEEAPTWQRWPLSRRYEGASRFVMRRFYCPGCATQVAVEVNRRDAPPVWSIEVLPAVAASIASIQTAKVEQQSTRSGDI